MEFYAPPAKADAVEIEAVVWDILKVATLPDGRPRFADNTIKWANLNEHPQTHKFSVVLPDDWRELGFSLPEVQIKTIDEMREAGWFPVNEIA